MCGVVAVLGPNDISEPMRRLAHRGLRSKVVYAPTGNIGHVRLPIVGLGEEHDQPVNYKDLFALGFVGEILDFRERRPGMECDLELVVSTWRAFGPRGFNDFDGFWGIVVIQDRRLHVLTDYLGQKPMYYRPDFPSAASEIDALVPFAPVTLDKVYLADCVKWGYCPDVRRTPYNEIKHALPGEHIVLDIHGIVRREVVDELVPASANPDEIRTEIEYAVKRRVLSSDVSVACLVSGGLDSAIVWRLARRHGQPIPYHVTGDEEEYWSALEVVRLSEMSAAWSPQPVMISIPQSLKRCRYEAVDPGTALDIMQEPIDLGSLRPQIALSRTVQQRVCLTGDGADELFGGYERSMRYDSQYSDVFQELPAWHLPRLDRVMMRERIEVRSPFLARRVAQMALALPHRLRQDKGLLRSLFADALPPSVTGRPKRALRTPEIEGGREQYSKMLVDRFVENFNAQTA
jgi:asparagine synthase (glutamine-hydrolysing)